MHLAKNLTTILALNACDAEFTNFNRLFCQITRLSDTTRQANKELGKMHVIVKGIQTCKKL